MSRIDISCIMRNLILQIKYNYCLISSFSEIYTQNPLRFGLGKKKSMHSLVFGEGKLVQLKGEVIDKII